MSICKFYYYVSLETILANILSEESGIDKISYGDIKKICDSLVKFYGENIICDFSFQSLKTAVRKNSNIFKFAKEDVVTLSHTLPDLNYFNKGYIAETLDDIKNTISDFKSKNMPEINYKK